MINSKEYEDYIKYSISKKGMEFLIHIKYIAILKSNSLDVSQYVKEFNELYSKEDTCITNKDIEFEMQKIKSNEEEYLREKSENEFLEYLEKDKGI